MASPSANSINGSHSINEKDNGKGMGGLFAPPSLVVFIGFIGLLIGLFGGLLV